MDIKKTKSNIDIKSLKGTMSVADFADGLLAQKRLETFGAYWEDAVTCDRCPYVDQCKALCDKYSPEGIDIYCGQVIDYLLGDIDLETLPKEEQ